MPETTLPLSDSDHESRPDSKPGFAIRFTPGVQVGAGIAVEVMMSVVVVVESYERVSGLYSDLL